MRQITGTIVSLMVLIALLAGPASHLQAQRISPGTEAPDQEETTDDQSEQSSERQQLILPEPQDQQDTPGREERSMYNRSMVEQLKADSAAMRVKFEETISELRSDSEAMRERYEQRIEKLQQRISSLEEEIESLKETRQAKKQPDTSPDREELELPGTIEQSDTGEETTSDPSGEDVASEGTLFNPNTASLSDLKSIPDLSDRLAERIEWYRREVRPFKSRNDLQRVPGIDRQTFQQISTYFHEGPY